MPLTTSRPRLAFDRVGDEGSDVLLIMGFGMRGVVWRPQVERLKRAHRVVYFDNRGVGGSDPSGPWLTVREMAEDALRLLDELDIAHAHVVGVSMGGMISQELAIFAPSRVRSLSLIATHAGGPFTWVPPRVGLRGFLTANLSRTADERVDALLHMLYPPDFIANVDDKALQDRVRDQVGMRIPSMTLAAQMSALVRHRTAGRLHRITAPTLILKPGRDVLVRPSENDRLGRLIPGAEVVELASAGHGITFQCAQEVNERLLGHFARADTHAR